MTLAQFDALPDAERGYWIAEWQLSRLECECGRPVEECSDPARKFYPYRRICYATMEREAAQAAYADMHGDEYHDGTFTSWSKKRSPSHPYPFDAGVRIGVADTDVAPWDHFTTERNASPLRPEESPDHEDDAAGPGK